MSVTTVDGIDYGPLAVLSGTLRGDHGLDTAPVPVGEAHKPFYDTRVFGAAGDLNNAGRQTPFVCDKAGTIAYRHRAVVQSEAMSYAQSTLLCIYNSTNFEHTDASTLRKVS
ncbi:MAG: hypothetical protein AAGA91_12330 [Pseudomonadota bacterium]